MPDFKQRIAGKSVPFEKFSVHKAKKYFAQNKWLFLPGLVSDLQLVDAASGPVEHCDLLIDSLEQAKYDNVIVILILVVFVIIVALSKSTFSQPCREKCIREVIGIGGTYNHLNCVIIFVVRLQDKVEIDHSWE